MGDQLLASTVLPGTTVISMEHFGKVIDEVRAQETRELRARGREPVLTKSAATSA